MMRAVYFMWFEGLQHFVLVWLAELTLIDFMIRGAWITIVRSSWIVPIVGRAKLSELVSHNDAVHRSKKIVLQYTLMVSRLPCRILPLVLRPVFVEYCKVHDLCRGYG
jgi:hypothetical protein